MSLKVYNRYLFFLFLHHAIALEYYRNCLNVQWAFLDQELTNNVTTLNNGVTYFLPMTQLDYGGNSIMTNTFNAELCTRVCPNGTPMSFIYQGLPLVCMFQIPDITTCVTCTHYCKHSITISRLLTSKDVCYYTLFSDPKPPKESIDFLQAFWVDFTQHSISNNMLTALQTNNLPYATIQCLKSYIGLTSPIQTGTCVNSLKNMCFGDLCISSVPLHKGFTSNKNTDYGTDQGPKFRCRLSQTPPDYSLLSVCSECIIEGLTAYRGSGEFNFNIDLSQIRLYCREVSVSVGTTVSQDALTILTWLSNGQHPFTAIEFTGYTSNTAQLALILATDLKLRNNLYSVDLLLPDDTNTRTLIDPAIVTTQFRYITYQGIDFELLKLLSVIRNRFKTGYIISNIDSFTTIQSYGVHYEIRNLVSQSEINLLIHIITTTYLITDNSVPQGESSNVQYFYYIGSGAPIYCPYMTLYTPGLLMLSSAYLNTTVVPKLNMYWAKNGFNCTLGPANPSIKCNKTQTPISVLSMTQLRTITFTNNDVFWDDTDSCFWYTTGGDLCSFSSVDKTFTSDVYLLDGRVSNYIQEFDTYYVSLRSYHKFIVEFSNRIELIPVDQICGVVSLDSIPTCITAVCGTDEACKASNAEGVCTMDESMRSSIQILINEYEYAKTLYTKATSVTEVWQQTENLRQARVVEYVALALSVIAVGLAASAVITSAIAVDYAQSAFALAEKNQEAITQLTHSVEGLTKTVRNVQNEVLFLEGRVIEFMADTYTLTTEIQNSILSVNARISDLETSVNQRFTQVATYVSNLATTLQYTQKSVIYFQQLQILTNFIIQSTSKLVSQTTMYSTCFQNLHLNRLYGCPLTDPYLTRNPDYALVSSVLGVIYTAPIITVIFKVPIASTSMAIYSVGIKPIQINDIQFVIDTSSIVMAADGNFYKKPICEGKYCLPLEQDDAFRRCFVAVTTRNLTEIQTNCNLKQCLKPDCSDLFSLETLNGTLFLPADPIYEFKFVSPNDILPNLAPLVLLNSSTYANISDISGSLTNIQTIQHNLQTYFNKSSKDIENSLQEVEASNVLVREILERPLRIPQLQSMNILTIIAITAAIINFIILIGLVIYACLSYKKLKNSNNTSSNNSYKYSRLR